MNVMLLMVSFHHHLLQLKNSSIVLSLTWTSQNQKIDETQRRKEKQKTFASLRLCVKKIF